MAATRLERDFLGSREIPADAYYGIHTLRALENFPITGTPISTFPRLVDALASVKAACALANRDLGLLSPQHAEVIEAASADIHRGLLHDQFVVDVIQGGAGTSTNMNANEVIANRGLELLGHPRGAYEHLHPHEHVNKSQSTNDVYPTAIKVALHGATDGLLSAMQRLQDSFAAKSVAFSDVLKMGRTQLQDAVPMTLGQEFGTFAVMVGEDQVQLRAATALVREINLGGTAIGTGLNAHPRYAALACEYLRAGTGIDLSTATDLVEATQDVGAFVQVSGVLKRIAVKLSKMCSDLRLLSSGPRAGLGEIDLPAVQAGSSIMPGKVNPVIPEVVNQVAFEVVGNDVTVSMAAEAGQLQLNAFEPIIARSLFDSIEHLRAACDVLAERCVDGIVAHKDHLRRTAEGSIGLATALVPYLGYGRATELAQEATATGSSIPALVLERGLLTPEVLGDLLGRLDELVAPRALRSAERELG
jgi:aspartate ammonia-lyase